MKVFGCGMGRTGTSSLRDALDILGHGPTLHAHAFGEASFPLQRPWHNLMRGVKVPWPSLLGDHQSAVDWPVAYYWRTLAEEYPDARFILTHRPAKEWLESFKKTILRNIVTHYGTPLQNGWGWGVIGVLTFNCEFSDENLLRTYAKHIADVRAHFHHQPGRLLEFSVKDGWSPLCRFLGATVPDTVFPSANDAATFDEDTIRIDSNDIDSVLKVRYEIPEQQSI